MATNTCNGTSGGLYLNGGGIANNCIISDNSGPGGGGIRCVGGTLKNCLLIRNISSGSKGGGGFLSAGSALSNCTVAGNTDAASGVGGLYMEGTAGSISINNCIIWGNVSGSTSNMPSYSTIPNVNGTCSGPAWTTGIGNMGFDPLFVNTNNANYRLVARSPCINTGTNQSWMTDAVDLDGRMRIRYGTVDMGAYEVVYNGTIYIIP